MQITTRSRRAHPGLIYGLTLLAGLGFPLVSSAALVTYTMNGTGMTGSFAGTSFTDATWSITVTGDTDDVFEAVEQVAPGVEVTYFLNFPAQQPAINIADGSNDWTAFLLDTATESWGVLALDLTPAGLPGSVSGFTLADNATRASVAEIRSNTSPGVSSDLATSAMIVGFTVFEEPLSLATSGGLLVIDQTAQGQQPASTFRVAVAAAPVPGTLALVGLGLVGLMLRRRHAGAGRSAARLG